MATFLKKKKVAKLFLKPLKESDKIYKYMAKVINFEENFPLEDPETWYSFTNDEGLDISSYAHTQIKFKDVHKDEIQNQYYQPSTEEFPSLCHPDGIMREILQLKVGNIDFVFHPYEHP